MELRGRIAVVTGAAGTIGGAITRALAADGLRLILLDIDRPKTEALAGTLPTDCYTAAIDLAHPEHIAEQFQAAVSAFGPADILVNNAGILSTNKLLKTGLGEWHNVFAVNLDGPFVLSQQVLPHMIDQRWGRIVNISSFAWKSGGITSGTSYSASKAGLVGLTFTIARETAPLGITVNGIAPTYVMSPMVTERLSEEQRKELLQAIPVRRFCEPEEVAHAVRFLVSPLASFITGTIIDMNGGFQFA